MNKGGRAFKNVLQTLFVNGPFHGNLGFCTHSCVKLVWEGHLVVVASYERMNELLVDCVDPEETTSLRSEHPLKPINKE